MLTAHPDTAKAHFDLESDLPPADQWLADAMGADGLPRACELYAEGYTTPEKCLEIDLEQFGARKGVGAKTVQGLCKYQDGVRGRQKRPYASANVGRISVSVRAVNEW